MRGIVGTLCALALLAPAGARASSPVDVYAHRGGAAIAPENTLGAFRTSQALFEEAGVDGWLEMDAQLTADGVLVVIHDDRLDRTTSCSGTVSSTTYAELAPCDAAEAFPGWGSFEPIPRLADLMQEAISAGWRLMVEIKNIPGESNFEPAGTAGANALVALVEQFGFPRDRLIVQAFWPPVLEAVRRADPTIRTALLTTSRLPGAPPGVGFTLTENATFAAARGYEISAPDQDAVDVTAEGVAYAHALGREVVVWTVDDAARIATLVAAGVDGIITNDPRLLL